MSLSDMQNRCKYTVHYNLSAVIKVNKKEVKLFTKVLITIHILFKILFLVMLIQINAVTVCVIFPER